MSARAAEPLSISRNEAGARLPRPFCVHKKRRITPASQSLIIYNHHNDPASINEVNIRCSIISIMVVRSDICPNT